MFVQKTVSVSRTLQNSLKNMSKRISCANWVNGKTVFEDFPGACFYPFKPDVACFVSGVNNELHGHPSVQHAEENLFVGQPLH